MRSSKETGINFKKLAQTITPLITVGLLAGCGNNSSLKNIVDCEMGNTSGHIELSLKNNHETQIAGINVKTTNMPGELIYELPGDNSRRIDVKGGNYQFIQEDKTNPLISSKQVITFSYWVPANSEAIVTIFDGEKTFAIDGMPNTQGNTLGTLIKIDVNCT